VAVAVVVVVVVAVAVVVLQGEPRHRCFRRRRRTG